MQNLDWGEITPESYNFETGVCTHIFNHDLITAEKIDRTIRFIIGRLNHFDLHLPENSYHHIIIDIRGQVVHREDRDRITNEVRTRYSKQNIPEIEFIQS